jgi:hypothetical protein
MYRTAYTVAIALLTLGSSGLRAQQPIVSTRGDDITIRGCLTSATMPSGTAPATLVWSRSDIMLAAAEGPQTVLTPSGLSGRVFYWMKDNDKLKRHVGQQVEIKGELEDIEKGKIEIDRDGDFTKIELDLDGKKETARVPTTWLSTEARKEQEIDIVARRIDVEDVKVIGVCRAR